MSVAATLNSFLKNRACRYDTVEHPFALTTAAAGVSAAIALRQVAKAVVLHHRGGYLVAVIPAMHKLLLAEVERLTGASVSLAPETEIQRIFGDCASGAIPALGQAYGLSVIWDRCLQDEEDIYLEAGDHRRLLHLRQAQFRRLMHNSPCGAISCAPDELYDMNHLRVM